MVVRGEDRGFFVRGRLLGLGSFGLCPTITKAGAIKTVEQREGLFRKKCPEKGENDIIEKEKQAIIEEDTLADPCP
jgi:hypothetical protein